MDSGTSTRLIRRHKRTKTPTVFQMEMVECGAACLAMILAYYKKYVPLEQLRVDCGVSRDGVRAGNIARAAEQYGLQAKGFRSEPRALVHIQPPAVIHWNFNHFVVFEGFRQGKAWINDPATGHRSMTIEEFDMAFTGVVLTFVPNWNFIQNGDKDSLFQEFGQRLSKMKSAAVFLGLISLMMVIPGILAPSFSRIFIDEVLISGQNKWLKPLLWAMAATGLLQALLTWLQQKYLLRIETKLALLGASNFFWRLLQLPVHFFQQRFPGDLATRVRSNDRVAAYLTRNLAENLLGLLCVLFYFAVMLSYSPRLSVAVLCAALAGGAYSVAACTRTDELTRKNIQDYSKFYGVAASGLHRIETLKATGGESGLFVQWAGHHARQLNSQQQLAKTNALLQAVPRLLAVLAQALMLCLGGMQVLEGSLSVGSLVAFHGLTRAFLEPVNKLASTGVELRRLRADLDRLDDILHYPVDSSQESPAQGDADDAFRMLEGSFTLRGVSYGYIPNGPAVLDQIQLSSAPGKRIALVGVSGSGKSTLVRIVAGLYEPWTGQLTFDGVRKQDLPPMVLTNSISIAEQDACLFEGTVLDNITMWDTAIPYASVVQAAKDACIHQEIIARDGGYHTPVAESGANFSGGQRQRLEIARALAKSPSILILDEAASALDIDIEKQILDNIAQRGCTCLVATHRLEAIQDFDEILVLEGGRIVQRGTHSQLAEQEGAYHNMVDAAAE